VTSAYQGHAVQERALIDALASGRMPHAWLLAGPEGLGKAGFARRAATFLIADGDWRAEKGADSLQIDPDDQVARLVANEAHPEFLWLKREVPDAKRPKDGSAGKEEDIARNITIGQVRNLLQRLRVRPGNARWRAVVIDSIDDLERSAANALLKTLEEPPAQTVFFLISHQPGRLLPTIRSRCRVLRFAPLVDSEMRHVLRSRLPDASAEDIEALLRVGRGSPGRAMMFGALRLAEIDARLREIAESGDRDNRLRVELAKTLSGSSEKRRFEAMLVQASALSADLARSAQGERLARALAAREHIMDVAALAVNWSEDPATVSFVVGNALAAISGDEPTMPRR
jgi:DNA polymerase-3 subunit delta'